MLRRIRPSTGSAHVLAAVALFAALGGGGAFALAKSSPKTQVTACYAKQGGDLRLLLKATKCAKGERKLILSQRGAKGATGATGPQGPVGTKGDKGDRGLSAFDAIPSGTTVRGVAGGDFIDGSTGTRSQWVTLPAPAPVALDNAHLRLASADPTNCPGTAQAPAAAAGFGCVYILTASGSTTPATPALSSGQSGEAAKLGFGVRWTTSAATNFIVVSWAYTAP